MIIYNTIRASQQNVSNLKKHYFKKDITTFINQCSSAYKTEENASKNKMKLKRFYYDKFAR